MEWIEIFKAGKWTDMSGIERNFTEADLDTIISKTQASNREAPLVLGHPKHNDPAYGWVEGLKREGNKLLMKCKQVAPAFAEWVKDGRYKKKSISLYPDMTLRHVGFLGAMQPAVPGLADACFAERENAGEVQTFEFGDGWKLGLVGRLLQKFRDYMVEKEGLEKADTMLPQWELDALKEPPADEVPRYAEPAPAPAPVAEPPPAPAAPAPAAAAPAAFAEETESLKARVAELEREKRKTVHKNAASALVEAGRLLPAHEETVLALMEAADQVGEYAFAEGKKPLFETFLSFLCALPVQIDLVERAKDGQGRPDLTNPEVLAQRARDFVEAEGKKGHYITVSEAVTQVLNQGVSR